jgi:PII-like signaling protein
MTRRIRIEVLVDAPLARKLADMAAKSGITGYTLLRTVGGAGSGGEWSEDLLSGATAKFIFLAIASAEKADRFMEEILPLLDSHQLVVMRSEVDVARPQRF